MIIQPATLQFLNNLSQNNDKIWFDANRKQYENAKKDIEVFVQHLIEGLSALDPDIANSHLQAKECMMRIFRDVRFSSDKTPYKTNFFAYLSKGGRKGIHAGYYFNLGSGGKSFSGGGLYMPMPPELAKVRQEIAYEFSEFQTILEHKDFQTQFEAGLKTTETLSRPPQGYPADHPAIGYLKNKSFFAVRDYEDAAVLEAHFIATLTENFKAVMPLVHFINRSFD